MKSFVTGLPRSRTAFFATLLTWTDSLFFHDPPCLNKEELRRFILHHQRYYGQLHLGISDASLLLHWRTLVDWFPDAKWVYIDRDFDEVRRSCESAFGPVPGLYEMSVEANKLVGLVDPFVVDFKSVNGSTCHDIAEYLGVDIGPTPRVEMLCDMNVQIHPPVLRRRLESLKCQPVVDAKEAA